MKFKFLIFVLLFVLSTFPARRIRSHRDGEIKTLGKTISNSKTVEAIKKTVGYRFIWGFMAELSGKGEIIETCITEIKAVLTGDDSKPTEEAGSKKSSSASTTMEKIVKYLGIAIDVLCIVKHFILSALTRRFRRFKRFRRLFIQGRSTRRFRLKVEFHRVLSSNDFFDKIGKGFRDFGDDVKNGIKGLGDDIKDKFEDFGHDIKETFEEIGNSKVGTFFKKTGEKIAEGVTLVGDKIGQGFQWFKDKCSEAFNKVVEYLKRIKDKIVEWVNGNKNIKLLISIVKCLIKVGSAYWKVQVTLTKVATLGVTLANPIGYVTLILNFMCGWKLVKKGVEWFRQMTNEDDRLMQAEDFGRFIANIAAAFAGLTK